jgi:hypothetical protein
MADAKRAATLAYRLQAKETGHPTRPFHSAPKLSANEMGGPL